MQTRTLALLALSSVAVATAGCAADTSESVDTSEEAVRDPFAHDKTAYNYFVGKGLKPFQAAGIIGNLDQESGDNPEAIEPGGPGRGIAQWSVHGRWDTKSRDNVAWYARTHGLSEWAEQTQLDFIWYELETFSGYGLSALRRSTDV